MGNYPGCVFTLHWGISNTRGCLFEKISTSFYRIAAANAGRSHQIYNYPFICSNWDIFTHYLFLIAPFLAPGIPSLLSTSSPKYSLPSSFSPLMLDSTHMHASWLSFMLIKTVCTGAAAAFPQQIASAVAHRISADTKIDDGLQAVTATTERHFVAMYDTACNSRRCDVWVCRGRGMLGKMC